MNEIEVTDTIVNVTDLIATIDRIKKIKRIV